MSRRWSPSFRRAYSALGETMLPPSQLSPWHGGDDVTCAIAERFFCTAPWFLRITFFTCVVLLEHSPLLLGFGLHRFSSLAPADRLRHLERYCRQMPFALVFAPLRPLVAVAAYSRPDALAAFGYSNLGLPRNNVVV